MSSTFRSKSSNETLTDRNRKLATETDAQAGAKSRCLRRALNREELKINCKIKIFRCINQATWTAHVPNWVLKFATSLSFQTRFTLVRSKHLTPNLRHTFLTSVIERDSALNIKSDPKSTLNTKAEADLTKINSFAHSLLTPIWQHITCQINKVRDLICRTKARNKKSIPRLFPLQPILMYFTVNWFQMMEAMRLRRARKCV